MSLFNLEFDPTTGELSHSVVEKKPVKKEKLFRIAVCYSGQARHWRTAVENNKRFFEWESHPETGVKVQVDYFIHTWDKNTWRYPKKGHEHFHLEEHTDADDIQSAYNPVAFVCQEFHEEKFYRAWDPMFYSNARSLMLKREHELANDFQYDIVIKARLDVVYPPAYKFPLQRVWPGTCYTCTPISKFPSEFNYNNFDDVLFYGDSPTMDLVGDIYSVNKLRHTPAYIEKVEATKNLDVALWYGPGCLLYDHCTDVGIHPDGNRVIEYAVVRSTAVEAKLDGIYDYDEIRKKWFEWYI
jgi:hypothetical protein